MAATDLVTPSASAINSKHLVLTQADGARPFWLRLDHPGVAEYTSASGQGNAITGALGYYFDGKKGRESIKIDLSGDARYVIEVKEGVKGASWQALSWSSTVGATRVTGNPGKVTIY